MVNTRESMFLSTLSTDESYSNRATTATETAFDCAKAEGATIGEENSSAHAADTVIFAP